MLDNIRYEVGTAEELNTKIRNIFALDNVGRGDEIGGTMHVYYSDDAVKLASLVGMLENRGVVIEWHKLEDAKQ